MPAPRVIFGCGSLFVLYMLALYLALGLAAGRRQVLEIGLMNYLWPAFTLLLAPVVLKKKAGLILIPGTLLALAGVFLVLTSGHSVSFTSSGVTRPQIHGHTSSGWLPQSPGLSSPT